MAEAEIFGPTEPLRLPESLQNFDIINLVTRADSFRVSAARSMSATLSFTHEADLGRMKQMHARLQTAFDLWKGKPLPDFPNVHPYPLKLQKFEDALTRIQNNDVQSFINYLGMFMMSLAKGQSAELTAGFTPADEGRAQECLNRLAGIIQDIEDNGGVDVPDAPDQNPPVNTEGQSATG